MFTALHGRSISAGVAGKNETVTKLTFVREIWGKSVSILNPRGLEMMTFVVEFIGW